jgi:catechol-2,3-dioxygenase
VIPEIEAFDHVHVFVADRVAAEEWYARVLGLRRAAQFESWATARGPLTLQNPSGSVHVALFERPTAQNRVVIALRVGAAQFVQWLRHLQEDLGPGVSVEDHDLSMSLYFTDPDGNPYEMTTYEYADVKGRLSGAVPG